MPIFQEPDRNWEQPTLPPSSPSPRRRASEESVRTEFCEGPVPDDVLTPLEPIDTPFANDVDNGMATDGFQKLGPRDRAALIERIKRSQPAPWRSQTLTDEPSPSSPTGDERGSGHPSLVAPHAALLPAIRLKDPISPEQAAQNEDTQALHMQAGRDIQRPPSALHAGDFTQPQSVPQPGLKSRPALPWSPLQSTSGFPPSLDIGPNRHLPPPSPPLPDKARSIDFSVPTQRPRAPSYQSYNSSFIYKPPTSPLVQQENNDDIDFSLHSSRKSGKENRRRTLPADGLQNLRSLPSSLAQAARQPGSFQADLTFLSQSREARRSAIFSHSFLGSVSPPTPGYLRSRRTSFSGESSPLQPSSMVGSYEESILRGRMSTTPSKPVEFTAQIGALGKGDCKPKFPDHVTLSFPAVFYNWNTFESTISTEPSPYVGQVDLQHGLPPPKRKENRNKVQEKKYEQHSGIECGERLIESSERSRRRKRSISPSKRPVGGSYRIPQQGQLQILIKNPNKTAVKLFLIPYDLEEMSPGTKTFIRQNSYSAGPIIEPPILTRTQSESSTETKSTISKERSTLRYSIHLHICCPAKGRYYLYKSIKVVFANRVPDNKERLRNEIRLPEPRFSPYRPNSELLSSPSMSSLRLSLEREDRRSEHALSESFEGTTTHLPHPHVPSFPPPSPTPIAPARRMIRNFSRPTHASGTTASMSEDIIATDGALLSPGEPGIDPFVGLQQPGPVADVPEASRRPSSSTSSESAYNKLKQGDIGYGGLFARPGTPEYSGGLLSRKLRTADPRGSPGIARSHEASS